MITPFHLEISFVLSFYMADYPPRWLSSTRCDLPFAVLMTEVSCQPVGNITQSHCCFLMSPAPLPFCNLYHRIHNSLCRWLYGTALQSHEHWSHIIGLFAPSAAFISSCGTHHQCLPVQLWSQIKFVVQFGSSILPCPFLSSEYISLT
jgi:hypothetical protein